MNFLGLKFQKENLPIIYFFPPNHQKTFPRGGGVLKKYTPQDRRVTIYNAQQ